MTHAFHYPIERLHAVLAPERVEFGAAMAKFVGQRADLSIGTFVSDVDAKRGHHATSTVFLIGLGSTDGRITKEQAKDIALIRLHLSVVSEHKRGRAAPGQHIPRGRLHDRRTVWQRVGHAL